MPVPRKRSSAFTINGQNRREDQAGSSRSRPYRACGLRRVPARTSSWRRLPQTRQRDAHSARGTHNRPRVSGTVGQDTCRIRRIAGCRNGITNAFKPHLRGGRRTKYGVLVTSHLRELRLIDVNGAWTDVERTVDFVVGMSLHEQGGDIRSRRFKRHADGTILLRRTRRFVEYLKCIPVRIPGRVGERHEKYGTVILPIPKKQYHAVIPSQ